MIQAKHHIVIYRLFKWLTCFLLKQNFNSIHIESDFIDNGKPVVLIANHISWWDGFWMEYLNQKITHRMFHFMMLEEQLKKHWYFKYTGGYSVKRKSRDIVESIDYTIELLNIPDNIILMFPQGVINSAYNNSIHFERGIQQIIDKSKNDFQVLLVANFTDYFSNAKPNLFIYTKTCSSAFLRNNDVEKEYKQFYAQILSKHKTKTS